MSTPIKRFSLCADDEAEAELGKGFMCESDDGGDYVLHSDHLASHAFDEAKERELFEAYIVSIRPFLGAPPLDSHDGVYPQFWLERSWKSWSACAKSCAKAAGCE
jgi:hypothetical protein